MHKHTDWRRERRELAHKKHNLFEIDLKWAERVQREKTMHSKRTTQPKRMLCTTVKEMFRFSLFYFLFCFNFIPFRIRFACVFNLFYHVPCLEGLEHFVFVLCAALRSFRLWCVSVVSFINLFNSISICAQQQSRPLRIFPCMSICCLFMCVCAVRVWRCLFLFLHIEK